MEKTWKDTMRYDGMRMADEDVWISTKEACRRLGLTLRTLYRLMDEGQLAGYRFGRVFRLKAADVDAFIEASRITPGELAHLYPEPKKVTSDSELEGR